MGEVIPGTPERALILKEAAMKKVVLVFIAILALCAMPGQSAATGNGEYDAALKAYYSGHYKKAVADLKDYVNRKPDAAAYYLIGYGLYKLGKYKEATEYFDQSYLIDPTFSPEEIGFEKFATGMRSKPARRAGVRKKAAMPKKDLPAGVPVTQTGVKHEKVESAATAPASPPVIPKAAPSVPASAPPKVAAGKVPGPPPAFPSFPKAGKSMPGMVPALLTGLFAGFAMILLAISLAFYIYWCLCLFMIARKLDVPSPWTAWIPFVQIWTFVTAAGKPWWWILLLFVPLLNIVVGIYLWTCITENLGRNKWLGLLMLVPLVNVVFIGVLAFARLEKRDTLDDIEPA
jgi:Family of unknown function (DUF5684)/Tetratricopeptide repeat